MSAKCYEGCVFLKKMSSGLVAFILFTKLFAIGQAQVYTSLSKVGDTYRFGLISDTHIRHERFADVFANNMRTSISELNQMQPPTAFVVFNGDLVNLGWIDETQFDDFAAIARQTNCQPILVHGNHDGLYPMIHYRRILKELGGPDNAYYSFDVGKWHYIVLPAFIPSTDRYDRALLSWLREDLINNSHKPTMIFVHYHILPVGLTQLESYGYSLELRKELFDLFTGSGNVRYVFSGHTHIGIKASIETAWTYKNTNFILVPTTVPPRPFGEDFPEYQKGDEWGGYYMTVEVEGEKAVLKGHLNGVKKAFIYPERFREFEERIDPRWFKPLWEFEGTDVLVNGGFEDDWKGFLMPYRYNSEEKPIHEFKISSKIFREGQKSAYLFCRSTDDLWTTDNMIELYQIVTLPANKRPILCGAYRIEETSSFGGGFIRICGYKDKKFLFMMLLHWGKGQEHAMNTPDSFAFHADGVSGAHRLVTFGKDRKAMFWDLPEEENKWHNFKIDIQQLFESSMEVAGLNKAFSAEKLVIAFGVWNGREKNTQSSAYFDDLSLGFVESAADSYVDGKIIIADDKIFKTSFGLNFYKKFMKLE